MEEFTAIKTPASTVGGIGELETPPEARRRNALGDPAPTVFRQTRARFIPPPTIDRDPQVVDVREQRQEDQKSLVGRRDIVQLEGGYRCARKLCEKSSYSLFVETVEFTGTDDESVWFGLLETIENGGWVGDVGGPREVKCLDISAQWYEVGGVRS